jgi:hypothetical protein
MLTLLVSTAFAGRPALEPQIKLHGGLSMVAAPAPAGFILGMDSRLTRFVWVDLGAFASVAPLPAAADLDLTGDDPSDFFRLRHSIYVLPGFRIPHPQPKAFTWDLVLRGGPSVVWSADLTPNDPRTTPNTESFLEIDVSGLAGVDLLVQRERIGLKGGAKFFALTPFYEDTWTDVLITGPQWSVELVYQI